MTSCVVAVPAASQQLAGRTPRPRSGTRPVLDACQPGPVCFEARRPREVGPATGARPAALDGELGEDVAPAGEQPLLLGAGFDDELRPRDRDERGEGVALGVVARRRAQRRRARRRSTMSRPSRHGGSGAASPFAAAAAGAGACQRRPAAGRSQTQPPRSGSHSHSGCPPTRAKLDDRASASGHGGDGKREAGGDRGDRERRAPPPSSSALDEPEAEEHARGVQRLEPVEPLRPLSRHRATPVPEPSGRARPRPELAGEWRPRPAVRDRRRALAARPTVAGRCTDRGRAGSGSHARRPGRRRRPLRSRRGLPARQRCAGPAGPRRRRPGRTRPGRGGERHAICAELPIDIALLAGSDRAAPDALGDHRRLGERQQPGDQQRRERRDAEGGDGGEQDADRLGDRPARVLGEDLRAAAAPSPRRPSRRRPWRRRRPRGRRR